MRNPNITQPTLSNGSVSSEVSYICRTAGAEAVMSVALYKNNSEVAHDGPTTFHCMGTGTFRVKASYACKGGTKSAFLASGTVTYYAGKTVTRYHLKTQSVMLACD